MWNGNHHIEPRRITDPCPMIRARKLAGHALDSPGPQNHGQLLELEDLSDAEHPSPFLGRDPKVLQVFGADGASHRMGCRQNAVLPFALNGGAGSDRRTHSILERTMGPTMLGLRTMR